MYTQNLTSAIMGEIRKYSGDIENGHAKGMSPHLKKLYRYMDMANPITKVSYDGESHNTQDDSVEIFNCTLLSIDAWRDDCGWFWNDIHKIESDIMVCEDSDILTNSRKLLAWFRQQDWLTDTSKGKVRVDFNDDIVDGVLLVIENKNTGEPILALSSIH